MTDQIEELRERGPRRPFEKPASRRPPSFGPILRGEVIREGDGEILAELSGRPTRAAWTGAMAEISFDAVMQIEVWSEANGKITVGSLRRSRLDGYGGLISRGGEARDRVFL